MDAAVNMVREAGMYGVRAGDGDMMRLSAGSLIRAHHSSLDSSGHWGHQFGSMPLLQETNAMLHNHTSDLDSELQVCSYMYECCSLPCGFCRIVASVLQVRFRWFSTAFSTAHPRKLLSKPTSQTEIV
jgi:hypothetical protein